MTAGAAGGLPAGAGTVRAASADADDAGKMDGIICRTPGRTGLNVPVVNLGVIT